MSLMLATLLLTAADPAPALPATQPVVEKPKPRQICQMIEITGSRARKRVCRDINGDFDLSPGVSNTIGSRAKVYQPAGEQGVSSQ